MIRVRKLPLVIVLLLPACSSVEPDPLPRSELNVAEMLLEEGDPQAAWNLLKDYERSDFDRQTQGDYSLMAGDAVYQLHDYDEAIKHYEEFLQFEGAASESREAEERLLEMGLALLSGDRKTVIVFTNKSKGAITLERLAAWAPYSPLAAEALARLGEYHYAEEDYEDAIHDYRQILRFNPNSEWTDLATFRLGMCEYKRIKNYTIDGNLMRTARNQIKGYLSEYPSGLYRAQANTTVSVIEEFIAEHEVMIGDFYEVIDNVRGARYHYRIAAKFGETEYGKEALALLEDLPPDPELTLPDFEEDLDSYQDYLDDMAERAAERAGAGGDPALEEATARERGSGG